MYNTFGIAAVGGSRYISLEPASGSQILEKITQYYRKKINNHSQASGSSDGKGGSSPSVSLATWFKRFDNAKTSNFLSLQRHGS
jgi:hypothetical protein